MTPAYHLVHEAGICDGGFSMVVKKIRNNLAISPILPFQRYIKAWQLCSESGIPPVSL